MNVSDQRTLEVKRTVDERKEVVRTIQAQLEEHNAFYSTSPQYWRKKSELKKRFNEAVSHLNVAKNELRALSGTGGGDPKWELIREAYRVLIRLEEAGIDIGERGSALLDSITFHVPASKLEEALGEEEGAT